MRNYFYEKRYNRDDGITFARRYSRSFQYGKEPPDLEPELYDRGYLERDTPPVDSDERARASLASSVSRARAKVRLLAFSNPSLVGLLTLTNYDIPSEDVARQRFDYYRRKVARDYPRWQFLGVKELQKRGSIHFHLLVNFCPDEVLRPLWDNPIQKQSASWKYGISDYQVIKGDDKFRTELYLLKYLTKGTEKLFTTYYVRSRNLTEIKPHYIKDRLPFPNHIQHFFTTTISNNYVENFEITEYTYIRN
jgi:hypothetical protein